jgi:hypothetical protein
MPSTVQPDRHDRRPEPRCCGGEHSTAKRNWQHGKHERDDLVGAGHPEHSQRLRIGSRRG